MEVRSRFKCRIWGSASVDCICISATTTRTYRSYTRCKNGTPVPSLSLSLPLLSLIYLLFYKKWKDLLRSSAHSKEVEAASEDTVTIISPVNPEEFDSLAPRFLFLEPPKDYVRYISTVSLVVLSCWRHRYNILRTELGTLLLDEELSGLLFVKGVWITDMKEERLLAGVDFSELDLDRDRRAVVKKSAFIYIHLRRWLTFWNRWIGT